MLTRPDPTRQNPAKSWPDPTRPAGPSDPWTTLCGVIISISLKLHFHGRTPPGPKIEIVIIRSPNDSVYSLSSACMDELVHGPSNPSRQFGQFRVEDGISKTIVLISYSRSTAYSLCWYTNTTCIVVLSIYRAWGLISNTAPITCCSPQLF